ncbi:pyridoxine 5'-phosphate synthase [Panacagrimonas perspica]|uniref:Pyridoxine 5'-phosphate synthase n=2 Tax=Panacagrimonas perspica TaxID=381431 RepID=A0A4R7NYF8_9GAMM|nr:pyridoxine 5'-phosphate synthase [Panacagrimonas perspica]
MRWITKRADLMSPIRPGEGPLPIRLGVNVDHVATLRQARGTSYPDPVEAALVAAGAGVDSITIHLREDRRHIQDHDLTRLVSSCPVPVNLELAVTDEMLAIASRAAPRFACLVPERREEITTEGGLDVAKNLADIRDACKELADAGIQVALFIDADPRQLDAALRSGAPLIEIHTGRYCEAHDGEPRLRELDAIRRFAEAAASAGLEVHAGHGLTVHNVAPIAAIPQIVELNIGHSLIARSVFIGLPAAIGEMRRAMTDARTPTEAD